MKIVVAPDSFKGSITAVEACNSIEKGILQVIPDADIVKIPMADGGEGTVQSLVDATGGKIIFRQVTGPLGNKVRAYFGILGDNNTAVIEMATASGLTLIPEQKRDPGITTTYGTGELIKAALDEGVGDIVIGIGGSATNDAGVGMAQALGVKFLDAQGREIGFGGNELIKIKEIDLNELDSRIKQLKVRVACDVANPLYGPEGAAYVYGPQKGATPEMIKKLDENLMHFAQIVKDQLGIDLQTIPGAGAAGGLGAGLVAFLGAELKSGVDIVMEANRFCDRLQGADLVITGEGKIDEQTIQGKTPIGVARKAKEYGIPVVALAGNVDDSAEAVLAEGIDAVFSIVQKPCLMNEVIKNTSKWLELISAQIIRVFVLSKR